MLADEVVVKLLAEEDASADLEELTLGDTEDELIDDTTTDVDETLELAPELIGKLVAIGPLLSAESSGFCVPPQALNSRQVKSICAVVSGLRTSAITIKMTFLISTNVFLVFISGYVFIGGSITADN